MRLDWLFMKFTCLLLGRIESFSRVQQNETVLFRVDIGMSKLCDFARKNGWFSKKEKKKLLPGLETELGSSRCVFIVVTIFFFWGGGGFFFQRFRSFFFFALFLCFLYFLSCPLLSSVVPIPATGKGRLCSFLRDSISRGGMFRFHLFFFFFFLFFFSSEPNRLNRTATVEFCRILNDGFFGSKKNILRNYGREHK